jgi:hypothetical protein
VDVLDDMPVRPWRVLTDPTGKTHGYLFFLTHLDESVNHAHVIGPLSIDGILARIDFPI